MVREEPQGPKITSKGTVSQGLQWFPPSVRVARSPLAWSHLLLDVSTMQVFPEGRGRRCFAVGVFDNTTRKSKNTHTNNDPRDSLHAGFLLRQHKQNCASRAVLKCEQDGVRRSMYCRSGATSCGIRRHTLKLPRPKDQGARYTLRIWGQRGLPEVREWACACMAGSRGQRVLPSRAAPG